jgi:pyruvate dehydrogenase E1 component alpha subunit
MPSLLGLFLNKNDSIYSHHRSHGYFLAKGGNINSMIAEFYGKATGTNGGLAGSQELSSKEINFNSGTILSGALAMSVGDAYSKKIKKSKNIAVTIIGDGGMEEGIVYESLNLAAVKKLPVLFICENNKYSTHTNVKERVKINNISEKVKKFGINSIKLNSNKYSSYISVVKNEINMVRKYGEPRFIEIDTYRFCPHVGPEDDDHYSYRSRSEIRGWVERDPLNYFRKIFLKNTRASKKINKVEISILVKINNAFKFARSSSYPIMNEVLKKNYSNTYSNVVKKFFVNKAKFNTKQEKHLPKPY